MDFQRCTRFLGVHWPFEDKFKLLRNRNLECAYLAGILCEKPVIYSRLEGHFTLLKSAQDFLDQ